MHVFTLILVLFLILCAVLASLSKSLFNTILIYMAFGTVLSVIWLILQAPDLSITEAAVGVGVDAVLYFLTLKKLGALKVKEEAEKNELEKPERLG